MKGMDDKLETTVVLQYMESAITSCPILVTNKALYKYVLYVNELQNWRMQHVALTYSLQKSCSQWNNAF